MFIESLQVFGEESMKNTFGIHILVLLLTVFLATSTATAVDPFKVIVLPDTQYLAEEPGKDVIFNSMVQYGADQNPAFMIHIGDLVDDGYNSGQWPVPDVAFKIADAAGTPYGVACGNHDYNYYLNPSPPPKYGFDKIDNFLNYFGPTRFADKTWEHGYKSLDGNDAMNAYHIFEGGGNDFLVIFLEMATNDAALAWAQEVIDDHPYIPTIIATHQYLYPQSGNKRISDPTNSSERYMRPGDTTVNTPEEIWQKLIKINGQIFMVVSGHHTREERQTSLNDRGLPVYEMMANYQNEKTGLLRELTFIPDQNLIEVRTYDSWTGAWETDADSRFDLIFDYDDYSTPVPGDCNKEGLGGDFDATPVFVTLGLLLIGALALILLRRRRK